MKKILIKAYSELNLGDDLFIKILVNRYPRTKFYLLTYHNYEKFKSDNLIILKYNLIQKIINKLFSVCGISLNFIENIIARKMDGIIEIGGSIFIQNKFYKKDLLDKKKLLKIVNNNYFIIGSNFGPYYDEEYLKQHEVFFKEIRDICFREKYSYELFKELKNTRLAKDIVFGLGDDKSLDEEYILYSVIKPSLRKELSEMDELYYKNMANSIIDLININKKIKLISFCKSEGDEEAIEKILLKIPHIYKKNISSYNYEGNLLEALQIIKKAEMIVATRFHAMILGFIYKKKVLPIAYSNKTINVLNDLKFGGEYITFNELNKLNGIIVINSKNLNEQELEKSKRDSEKHFKKIDLYLAREKDEK